MVEKNGNSLITRLAGQGVVYRTQSSLAISLIANRGDDWLPYRGTVPGDRT